jgi:hypothetical protein
VEDLSPAPNFSALKALRSDLLRVEALRDVAVKRLREGEARIIELEGEEDVLNRVADLFRLLIDKEVVDNAKTAEELLTEGLQAIFDDLDLSVKAQVDIKAGKVSVDLLTVQKQPDGTTTEGSPTDAYGGSVATVQSVLLRVVVLSRRKLRPLLLLDESLGAVAEHYVPRVGQFLALLCERMGIDVLAVSHNPVLVEAAHRAYRIQKKGGEASLRQIRTGQA